MPLPKPRKNETHKAFRSRCMSDPVMAEEYPDQDQRLAICEKQWEGRVKASSAPSHLYVEAGGNVEIQAAEGDDEKKLRRFTGTAYTGGVMRPSRFFTPVVVDLAGVKIKRGSRPILKEHDPEQIVGHSEDVKVTGRSISVSGVISGVGEVAREVVETSANGFPWKLSLGASVEKMVRVDEREKVEVNGQTFAGPLLVARRTTLGEISFVALAADDRTSARVAASAAEQEIEVIAMKFDQWLEAKGFDPERLDDKQKESLQAMYRAEKVSRTGPPGADQGGRKDAKGDTWSVVVNGGTIKRALDLLKVDLGDPLAGSSPLLTRFDLDIAFKVDLIYVTCLPEAEKRGITDVEFAERLEGDALYAASEAFLEALADFFQSLRRTHIVRAIAKQREVIRRAVEIADQTIASDEFDAKLDAELAELGDAFASLLESPASDQRTTPSEN